MNLFLIPMKLCEKWNKLSKQIIDNQNILVLNEMSWDSEFFDCSAYSLDTALTKLENPIQDSNILSKELKRSFITVKLPTNVSSLYLANLFVYGFNYIDTEVILRFDNRKVMLETTPFEIKELIVNKDIPYHELGSMFTSSRFHNDVNISSIKANILWIEYLKNFKPSKERKMFVAYDNASIIGVILVNITDQRCATLFYVSILKE